MRQLYIITHGNDKSGQAAFGLAQAAMAASLQPKEVMIFLVLDGAKWGFDDYGHEQEHECFDQALEHLQNCLDLEARVIMCVTCFKQYRHRNFGDLRKGIEINGLMEVQKFISEPCNCLTF